MNIFGIILGSFLALQLAQALPTAEKQPEQLLEGKVRDKRKIEDTVAPAVGPVAIGTSEETAKLPTESPQPPAVATLVDDKDLLPEGSISEENQRFKKQACLQTQCGTVASCGPCVEPTGRAAEKEEGMQILKLTPHMMKSARTIEPVYSFGPVSVNSAPSGYSGYGSYLPSRTLLPQPQHQVSYAPTGMQFSAVIPYAQHRHPLLHHSFETGNTGYNYNPRPEVVYYNPPEPIYVAAPVNTVAEEPHDPSPLSLYCESINSKNKDLGKSLPEERANATTDEQVNDHIQRVSEIKDEITQLNNAAQRIVDQQERLARMHQDHIAMVAAKSADPYPPHMRSFEPLMRHQESQLRMPYGMYGGGFVRPHLFRSADEPPATVAPPSNTAPTTESTTAQKGDSAPRPEVPKAALPVAQQVLPSSRAQEDFMRQGYYPTYPYGGYGGFGGYRAAEPMQYSYQSMRSPFPPGMQSEYYNGLPMMGRSASAEPVYMSQEDKDQFIMKVFEMGQKMGILSKDVQTGPASRAEEKKSDQATRPENALMDLLNGGNQREDKNEQPSKLNLSTPDDSQPPKKDKRGLIHKKKE